MIVNLTQHKATDDQRAAGVADVADSDGLSGLLTVPAEAIVASESVLAEFLESAAAEIVSRYVVPVVVVARRDWMRGDHGDTEILTGFPRPRFMVGGMPALMERLIPAIRRAGGEPVYSLSVRESMDAPQPDGSVRKVAVFRHIRFFAAA